MPFDTLLALIGRTTMSFKKMLLPLGLICFLFGSSQAVAAPSPTEQLREVVDGVMALLKQPEVDQAQRRQQMRDLIAPHFDFEVMSRSILAKNWKKADAAQRDRFVELFKRLMENTYIAAMESYTNETIRYGKEKIRKNKAVAETFIIRTGVEIPVIYRLRQRGDKWLAYDVVIEGVSIVRNYRSSFASLVKKQGIDGLLANLESKVQGG
ncbi:toluene tolerance protein [endosymbiont of Riftia pachyptila (vent Ph05)]|jgi:phospholipid transport system substrate-binding protein|uniref:Toluene tolerance protein n=2 Tax=endosymbiont of Riftia pachyptila TaxID=54396 RepID=G2DCT7_9GAMM|nr:toluene tolerance protein [endosymbiont of Riftia pachyptila (vent Ph05)]